MYNTERIMKSTNMQLEIEKNPFIINTYQGKEYFCDREHNLESLINNIKSELNTTLISIRRIGKTGLIKHLFEHLEDNFQYKCLFVDLFATQNLNDFANQLANEISKKFPNKESIGKRFFNNIKQFRPLIQFDALTGEPSISFDALKQNEIPKTIQQLLLFLEQQNIPIIIAFDEFQQINEYPEKNTEALLRTIIQEVKNLRFIFSGSKKHILTEIFGNSKRPFYASTQVEYLDFIPSDKYKEFIKKHFNNNNKTIQDEDIDFILNWTNNHTYFVQMVCNRLYASGKRKIKLTDIQQTCYKILKDQEVFFYQYRNLLSSQQWNVLKAISKEEKVYQLTGKEFLTKYKFSNASAVKRCVDSLLEKEMIYQESDENGTFLRTYDVFLQKWMLLK
jgi:uncharacterized protein